MLVYDYNNLNTYINSLNDKYGVEMISELMYKAMNFQADNVRLVSLKQRYDINAREETISIFVCCICDKDINERLIFLPSNDNEDIGKIGYILSPFYQSSEGSLKHSMTHVYSKTVRSFS